MKLGKEEDVLQESETEEEVEGATSKLILISILLVCDNERNISFSILLVNILSFHHL
jgi:hypothetical protein